MIPKKKINNLDELEQILEKNSLKYLDKDARYQMSGLKERMWLKTDKVWYEAFDDAPQKKIRYIRRMRENGEKLNSSPRITLSTIHGVKGNERENVVINTELSGAAYDEYQKNPDDTHRLFYVACTRTENNLFIIEPQRKKAYDI